MEDEPFQEIYFIGIALPPPLNEKIAHLKQSFADSDPAMLRPVLPHVTLLHPPSLAGIMPSELIPKVHEIANRYLPLTIAIEEVGSFDGTVCFLRVESLGLYSLQSQLVKLLPPEAQELHYKRPYTPHITIAQIHEPSKLDTDTITQAIMKSLPLPQQFTVDSISYFRRILPREYRAETI